MGLMKADHLRWTKARWEEAFAHDPAHSLEVALAVLGRDVWFWDGLTVLELRSLSSRALPEKSSEPPTSRAARRLSGQPPDLPGNLDFAGKASPAISSLTGSASRAAAIS